MQFKKIEIKYFRGIKKLSIENLSRVNLLLGQNNCGKSTILEAIFLLTGMNNPQLILNIDLFRNLAHNEENDFRFIFYKLNYDYRPEVYGELNEAGSHSKLTITPQNISSKNSSNKTIAGENISEISVSTDTKGFEIVEGLNLIGEVKKRHGSKTSVNSSVRLNREADGRFTFRISPDKNYKTDFKAIFHHSQIRNAQDISRRLEEIIIEKKKNTFIDSLKKVDKKIEDVTLGTNGMIYFDIGAERYIPANLMGDGVLKFMHILTNLNEVANGVLLIDEIDNGLHFASMRNLWNIILPLAKQNDVQLFITTHSKEALIYLKEILEDDQMVEYRDEVRCYTISKSDDDTVFSYEYDFNSFDFALQNDLEIRGEI